MKMFCKKVKLKSKLMGLKALIRLWKKNLKKRLEKETN